MGELTNCPNCGAIFVKTQFRDVCPNCWKEEEEAFDKVYKYIRRRENRAATIRQVEEATGVKEELILKFIKTGRLRTTHFPNLGYPCDKCGRIIHHGKLCDRCANAFKKDLQKFNEEEKRKKEMEKKEKQATYYAVDERFKGEE